VGILQDPTPKGVEIAIAGSRLITGGGLMDWSDILDGFAFMGVAAFLLVIYITLY
jgi:hypothetical protein